MTAGQAQLATILARPKRRMADRRPSEQAGIVCGNPAFWTFLRERKGMRVATEKQATAAVYALCGVESRRELVPGSEAAAVWNELHAEFDVWRRYERG